MQDFVKGVGVILAGILGLWLVWKILQFIWGCIGWIFKCIDEIYYLLWDFCDGSFILGGIQTIVCLIFFCLVCYGIAAFVDNAFKK